LKTKILFQKRILSSPLHTRGILNVSRHQLTGHRSVADAEFKVWERMKMILLNILYRHPHMTPCCSLQTKERCTVRKAMKSLNSTVQQKEYQLLIYCK